MYDLLCCLCYWNNNKLFSCWLWRYESSGDKILGMLAILAMYGRHIIKNEKIKTPSGEGVHKFPNDRDTIHSSSKIGVSNSIKMYVVLMVSLWDFFYWGRYIDSFFTARVHIVLYFMFDHLVSEFPKTFLYGLYNSRKVTISIIIPIYIWHVKKFLTYGHECRIILIWNEFENSIPSHTNHSAPTMIWYFFYE